ncbi:MAG: hypothetical protein PHY48_01405 [Candidatus Cloacimonetes bacterium]|nr:hypothetical protein [Candidatus Cloacimonadota bacterium]
MSSIVKLNQIRVDFVQPGLFIKAVILCFTLFVLLILPTNLSCTYTLQQKTTYLAVYAEEPISAALRQSLSGLDTRIDELQMSLGIYTDDLVPVYLVKDHKSYQSMALGKDKIVEFSEAFYSGSEGSIYIRPLSEIKDSFRKTLVHEYIHWYLESIFIRTPLWFHEGMATHYSGQMGFERYLYFLQESFIGHTSDLFRMSYSYPEKQSDWQIFYLSSSMAIRFMSEKKPEEWKVFWELVANHKRAGEKAVFNDCFALAYRSNLYDFNQQFAAYVKSLRFQYLFWGMNSLIALFLPLAMILTHYKRKKRMALLPDLPEFVDDEEDTEDLED